jgi:hypothetical protein
MMILLGNCRAETGNEDKFCPVLGIEKLQKKLKLQERELQQK